MTHKCIIKHSHQFDGALSSLSLFLLSFTQPNANVRAYKITRTLFTAVLHLPDCVRIHLLLSHYYCYYGTHEWGGSSAQHDPFIAPTKAIHTLLLFSNFRILFFVSQCFYFIHGYSRRVSHSHCCRMSMEHCIANNDDDDAEQHF